MTDEGERLTVDGGNSIDAVDPEAIAALDDEPNADGTTADDESLVDGPTPERFDEFVRDVDVGRVAAPDGADEDVPIDASMDELFAER